MNLALALVAALIGAGLTVQIGMNGAVRTALGSLLAASIVNFVVGLAALLTLALATGLRWPTAGGASVPAWAWMSGLIGAGYVSATTLLGPKLGATALVALIVFGQLMAALALDHYGALGFAQHPATPLRVLGAVLLIGGVILILRR